MTRFGSLRILWCMFLLLIDRMYPEWWSCWWVVCRWSNIICRLSLSSRIRGSCMVCILLLTSLLQSYLWKFRCIWIIRLVGSEWLSFVILCVPLFWYLVVTLYPNGSNRNGRIPRPVLFHVDRAYVLTDLSLPCSEWFQFVWISPSDIPIWGRIPSLYLRT